VFKKNQECCCQPKKKLCRCFFQLVDVIDDIVNDLSSLLMKRIEKKTVLQMFLQFVDVIDDIVDDFSSLLMKRKLCCRCFFSSLLMLLMIL
jgi:hypothetical protein